MSFQFITCQLTRDFLLHTPCQTTNCACQSTCICVCVCASICMSNVKKIQFFFQKHTQMCILYPVINKSLHLLLYLTSCGVFIVIVITSLMNMFIDIAIPTFFSSSTFDIFYIPTFLYWNMIMDNWKSSENSYNIGNLRFTLNVGDTTRVVFNQYLARHN